KTMVEVMEVAEENADVSKDEVVFLLESDNFYYVYPFVAGFGSYVFENNDGNYDIDDSGLDYEGAIEGGELIQSWYENDYMPTDLTEDIMNGLFKEGKVSTIITGPWMAREFSE